MYLVLSAQLVVVAAAAVFSVMTIAGFAVQLLLGVLPIYSLLARHVLVPLSLLRVIKYLYIFLALFANN